MLSDYQVYGEEQLARLVAAGDMQAFTSLLHRYWNKVYTQAVTWLKSAEDAQELTQDVFISIWQDRVRLAEVNSIAAWLSAITRNKIISKLRQKSAQLLELDETTATRALADERVLFRESEDIINRGIDMLSPVRKKVFLMSRMENKTYDEIAAELNISRNGVKDHIVKALNALREYIIKYGGDTSLTIFMIVEFLKRNSNP